MTLRFTLLSLLVAALWPATAQAWRPEGYAALALGFSLQSIPAEQTTDGLDDTILTNVMAARTGVEWIPGISTGIGFWLWGDKNVNTEAESVQFDGISAGWDVTFRIPFSGGVGPYVRVGRHCWSAVTSGLLDPWSEDGCSAMRSAGFNFPVEHDLVMYAEYSTTRFQDIDADSLLAGVQARF
ncbi:outer membrane beta-barrel protein [Thalassolituus sp. LLYu03]|uniref:outer membrane beta-barrel protein n=1 Tax=Thalassolituus sp. LLYu03 TaxID=3421656 RepID=UPI003D294E74